MPDLSIIIVSWNTCGLLRECLASCLLHLHGVSAEIIVIDNDSVDGSADMVASEFASLRLIRNDHNAGFAAANNQAMQLAMGRYLLLLNPDTLITSDVFRGSIDYMETHPDVGALGCRVLNSDHTVQPTCFRFPGPGYLALQAIGAQHLPWPRWLGWHRMRGWNRDTARDVEVITGCYLMTRRQSLEDVGLFDEQFYFYGEEADWCLRFRHNRWGVRFAPVGEIVHHGGASAMQLREGRLLAMGEAIVRLHCKHRGARSAKLAWGLCLLFNAIRLIGWSAMSCASRKRSTRRRAADCWRAIRRFHTLWPGTHHQNAAREHRLQCVASDDRSRKASCSTQPLWRRAA